MSKQSAATAAVLITACFIVGLTKTGYSQGLKGTPDNVHFGQVDLIDGKTDDERWQKLLLIEKNLIGMSSAEVAKKLGSVPSSKNYMQYHIAESQESSRAGKISSIMLTIKLKKGRVESFTIEAVRWAN